MPPEAASSPLQLVWPSREYLAAYVDALERGWSPDNVRGDAARVEAFGKGTIVAALMQRDPGLWLSRSWTTRPQRPSEKGDEYVFVQRDEFERLIHDGGLYEWAEFHGNLYGTPLPTPPDGADVLLEIEVQGARQVRDQHPDATVILLVPPSNTELEARLRARGDTDEHVARRLVSSSAEIEIGKDLANFVVVNDSLEETITQILGIISTVRQSRD